MSRIITRSKTCYKTKSSENGIALSKYKYKPFEKVGKHLALNVKVNSTNTKETPLTSQSLKTTNSSSVTTSSKVNKVQLGDNLFSANSTTKKKVKSSPPRVASSNIDMDKKVTTSPERISLAEKSTPTLESSKSPSVADTSKIKHRRNAVYFPEWHALKLPVNNTTDAVNPKRDENVIKTIGAQDEMVVDAIMIPGELKIVLLNDSVNINGRKKLYEIPTKLNVLKVIDDYIAMKCLGESLLSGRVIEKVFHDLVDEYFEKFLRSQLLYEFEHKQYDAIIHKYPGIAMSRAYPPVYLLRLLVQLNKLLPYSQRDFGTLQLILKYINEFVMYLAEHKSVFFD